MPARSRTRRRAAPEARRAELLDAAEGALREVGLDAVTVADITRRAGVAKGTFYLYFRSKDGMIDALVQRMVEARVEDAELVMARRDLPASERLQALGRSVLEIPHGAGELELVEHFHRPENRAVHDRMDEAMRQRLLPLLASVVADGAAAGEFASMEPRLAAGCVLGSLRAIELAGSDPSLAAAWIDQVHAFVLRGLGSGAAA